jgi:uncharacterized membrane protein
MSKDTFLKELSYLLQDIPDTDREDALAYYEDYFDAAGSDNEASVLRELQSPERVAALIKAGMRENFEETIEYSESSMGDSRYNRQHEVVIPKVEEKQTEEKSEKRDWSSNFRGDSKRNGMLILGILALIFIFGIPFFGVGFAVFVTIIILIFTFGFVMGVLGFAAIVAAIPILIKSIWEIGSYPAASLVGVGISLLLVSLAMLLFQYVKTPFKLIPIIVDTCVSGVREIIDRVSGGKK